MKLSTTAALFALAAAQGANAIDFDFRDFEGLWESPEQVVISGGTERRLGKTTLATVQCGATGDFRKAKCDVNAVIEDSPLCRSNSLGFVNAVADKMFILDQFDADSGETKVLMINVNCCNPATANAADPNNGCEPLADIWGHGEGMLNAQFTMLPGKSNNHVRAIFAKLGAGPSSDPFDDLEVDVTFRRTAGGFKSYD